MESFWLILVLSILLCPNTAAARAHNVVFILTDDQDRRMHSLEHMPNVKDLLIKEGTSYTRHYAPTALCCPARVSLWTGLYAHNHLVTDVGGVNGGWQQVLKSGLNDNYLPIWLRQNGYRTYYAGKLYNGMHKSMVEQKTARGWTKADLLVGSDTYQYFNPPFQHIEGNWDNPEKVHNFPGKYSTDKVAEYGYGYLKEAIDSGSPFFVAIAPITPHSQVGKNPGPPVPAKNYTGKRPNVKVPRAANFNPPEKSGVNVVWQLDELKQSQVKVLDYHYQRRTESLLSVDDMVAEVVKILKDANQLDNTYIIYSSDNGFHLGHHRLGIGKKFAFEEDINVPFIIRGPGVPKNKKARVASAHVDVAPTILDMAGIPQHADFDGKPIPYTADAIQAREKSKADEHANVEFWSGASFKMNGVKGIRVNSYKSLRLAGKGYDIMYAVQCHENAHELYNMKKDPVQMRNLYPSAPAEKNRPNAFHSGEHKLAGYKIKRLLPRLDALLLVLKSCKGDSCRHPWKQLHPDGKVKNLRDAMNKEFNPRYHSLPKVSFRECFKNGTIDLYAEGPQWHKSLLKHHNPSQPEEKTDDYNGDPAESILFDSGHVSDDGSQIPLKQDHVETDGKDDSQEDSSSKAAQDNSRKAMEGWQSDDWAGEEGEEEGWRSEDDEDVDWGNDSDDEDEEVNDWNTEGDYDGTYHDAEDHTIPDIDYQVSWEGEEGYWDDWE